MGTRAIVLITVGLFLLAMSILGLFESQHHSAKIVYSIMIPVSIGVLTLGIRARKTSRPQRQPPA